MALARLATKVKQAVTDAEKTEIDPALKELLRQFEETRTFGDNIRDATREELPIVASMSKMTKTETLGTLVKQAAAKYGTEKPEAAGLFQAGETLMALGKEERTLLQKVDRDVYTLLKTTHDFHEALKKEKSRLQTTATDMDGAKIKVKGKSGDQSLNSKVQSTTKAYEEQLVKVQGMVATMSEHRDKQRQAVKALLEALREFHVRAAEVIEGMIGNVG